MPVVSVISAVHRDRLIGASRSEPHTSDVNRDFSVYIYIFYIPPRPCILGNRGGLTKIFPHHRPHYRRALIDTTQDAISNRSIYTCHVHAIHIQYSVPRRHSEATYD